jgi:hypothetical protein
MSPPTRQRRGAPGHHPGDAAAKIKATAKRLDPPKFTNDVYPTTFAEWDQLVRERPFGRRWTA